MPAFYEIWAEYAKDGHEDFYRKCADISRQFLHKACHPETGLTPDYAEFDGMPHPGRMSAFGFDSWRVPMNIAMDYPWFANDKEWQQNYCNRPQNFLLARGIDKFEDQFSFWGHAHYCLDYLQLYRYFMAGINVKNKKLIEPQIFALTCMP